jgi:DeoR/GlpR family transcriptional regulator of sugar metabolism
MKVAYEVVKARRDQLAQLLAEHQYLPLAEVCTRLGISEATARRDLTALERDHAITRTYGGAVGDYNRRFESFRERLAHAADAKRRIAHAALAVIKANMTVYFDGGTTVYAVAEALALGGPRPLSVVTNNLMVAERLSDIDGIELNVLGGQYLRRQAVILGAKAQTSANLWRYDLALFGAEAMTARGLWNSQADVVAIERAVARSSKLSVFLVDASKLDASAPVFLEPWTDIDTLVTDATADVLSHAGITLPARSLVTC